MFLFSPSYAARAYAIYEGMSPPYPGLAEFPYIVDQLRKSPDNPQLGRFSDEVFSLFHRQASSSGPWVNELIVFAWQDGDQLLIADEGGAASLGTVGGQTWENGWFDFAMLDALRLAGGGDVLPVPFYAEWVRVENETRSELLMLDDVGKASVPEEGGRVLARVGPGETVDRPVLRSRPPWLIVHSGGRFRLDVTHASTTETMSGTRFSMHEAGLGDESQQMWGFVVEVEAVEADGTRLAIAAILVAIAACVAWAWAKTRRHLYCGNKEQ